MKIDYLKRGIKRNLFLINNYNKIYNIIYKKFIKN